MDEEAAGGKETDSSINVCSDWANRIDCIPHIQWIQMLVCEIPNIVMNFRSTRVWAPQPNLPQSNWKRWLRMERRLTKVQERFRSKWMARRTLIHIIPVQYWILFSTQSTTNLSMSFLMRWSGCWISIWFTNQGMTVFQSTSIQFQACPELRIWRTRFGPYDSSWEGRFGMPICQEHWWRMKWVLERLSPQLQRQCFANWWLRKL